MELTNRLNLLWNTEIASTIFNDIPPTPPGTKPLLVLLSGQPGAGKTQAQRNIERRYPQLANVTGDEFRIYHENFYNLATRDPLGMPDATSTTSGPLIRRALDYCLGKRFTDDGQLLPFQAERYSVLLEGTWRDTRMVIDTITEFATAGFDIQAVVVAVNENTSRLAIEDRFLRQYEIDAAKTRWTPGDAHDNAYTMLPHTLYAVLNHPAVSWIEIYNRDGLLWSGPNTPENHEIIWQTFLIAREQQPNSDNWLTRYAIDSHLASKLQIPSPTSKELVTYCTDPVVIPTWQQLDEYADILQPEPELQPAPEPQPTTEYPKSDTMEPTPSRSELGG